MLEGLQLNGVRIIPDRYVPRGKALGMRDHRLPLGQPGLHYSIPNPEDLGDAVITAVDHRAGTITADSDIMSRLQHAVRRMARDGAKPDQVFLNPDQYEQLVRMLSDVPTAKADAYAFKQGAFGKPDALAVGIAATCAIAGLGLLIARRNAVMAEEGPSESWLKAFIEWACAYVRALFATPVPALPAHEDPDAA